MIGVGFAMLVIGVIFLFVVPWVGIPVGIIGLVLVAAWLFGFGRRAAAADDPARQRP